MMIRKSYERSNLLISDRELGHRIRLIEKVTSTTAYQTKFERTRTAITRTIPRGPSVRPSSDTISPDALADVAKTLDQALCVGLVHGDIHWKNIIDSIQPTLVDWEPSLDQIKLGRQTLMVTYPWIDVFDRANGSVSVRTDLMCFARLIIKEKFSYFKTKTWQSILSELKDKKYPFASLHKSLSTTRKM